MRNFKYISLLVVSVLLTSCFEEPGTAVTWEGGSFVELDAATTPTAARTYSYLRLNDGTTYDAGFQVLLASAKNPNGVSVSFEIDAASTAIENVHYTVDGSTVDIPAGEFVGELPITISADAIESGEQFTIIVNLTDADVELGERSTATHRIQISCPSDLEGTYSYSTVNLEGGPGGGTNAGPVTGTGTLTALAALGQYTISDVSFGLYEDIWGDPPAGAVRLVDVCGYLSFAGADNVYGDTWTMSNLTMSPDRTEITFDYINGYGDNATTTLTRTDGKLWPIGAFSD